MDILGRILTIAAGIRLAKVFDTRDQQIQNREDARTKAICAAIEDAAQSQQQQQMLKDFFLAFKNIAARLDGIKTAAMQGVATPSDMLEIENAAEQLDELKTMMQGVATPFDMLEIENAVKKLDEIKRIARVDDDVSSPLPAKPPRYRQPNALDRFFGEKAPDEV